MPDVAGNPSLDARWRPWHALALLVAAHAVFNIIVNPTRERADDFPTFVLIGVFLVQPVLFATWTAMGPPPAIKRIPFSAAGFILLMFASNFRRSRIGLEFLMMPAALFAAALVVMLFLHVVTRWRVKNTRRIEGPTSATYQFSIKYLLVLTAVCAVVLGIGRAMALAWDWPNHPGWREFGGFVVRIWIIFLALIPAIAVPSVALAPRPTFRIILGTILASGILSLIAIETIILVDNPPRGDVAPQVLLIQLGAVLAGLVSALILRFAGYRLARRSKEAARSNQ